ALPISPFSAIRSAWPTCGVSRICSRINRSTLRAPPRERVLPSSPNTCCRNAGELPGLNCSPLHLPKAACMAGPLSHIRVLDLSRVLAGPWAGQNLADLGAEVIKVERPKSGDDARAFGPPWVKDRDGRETRDSAYFTSANRGKKSITVNIAVPEGQALIRALAASFDILIENYKYGDLARYGLGYDALRKTNPGLIYCSLTGFGQSGPWGAPPQRIGNRHPNIAPYQPFRSSDGQVILACGNDNLYRKFCAAAGCPALAEDPRFASNGKRVENRAELTRLLEQVFIRRSTREWVELLEAAGVPNGPINDVAQVFEEPQVRARGIRIELDHSAAGKLPGVASPMRFSVTRIEYRLAPPLLGEHTDEVLRGLLGKSDAEIARLRAAGVI